MRVDEIDQAHGLAGADGCCFAVGRDGEVVGIFGKRQFPIDGEPFERDADQRLRLPGEHVHGALIGREMHGNGLGTGGDFAGEAKAVGLNFLEGAVGGGQGVDKRPGAKRQYIDRRAI